MEYKLDEYKEYRNNKFNKIHKRIIKCENIINNLQRGGNINTPTNEDINNKYIDIKQKIELLKDNFNKQTDNVNKLTDGIFDLNNLFKK